MIKLTDIKRPHVPTEDELFDLIKKTIPTIKKTEDRFAKIDAIDKEKDLAIEFKSKTDDYNTILILEDKYNNLQVFKNNRYIIAQPNGIYSFNLKKIPTPIFKNKELKCITTSDVGDKEQWCNKRVGYLPLSAATKIN